MMEFARIIPISEADDDTSAPGNYRPWCNFLIDASIWKGELFALKKLLISKHYKNWILVNTTRIEFY